MLKFLKYGRKYISSDVIPKSCLTDEWLDVCLLNGLLEKNNQMVMLLENSGQKVTSEQIKTKLYLKIEDETNWITFSITKKEDSREETIKCDKCGKTGYKKQILFTAEQ